MINISDITDEQLYFSIYCITALSRNLNMSPSDLYKLLTEKTKILEEYIIKHYDTLHTQGEDYIVNEIVNLLKNKGISFDNMKMTEYDEILVMLIDDIILNISDLKSISKYDAMKLFYSSPISKLLDRKETGLFTHSAASLAYRCINMKN